MRWKWHKVEDGLPPRNENKWLYSSPGGFGIGHTEEVSGKLDWCCVTGVNIEEITHWATPKAPKDKK